MADTIPDIPVTSTDWVDLNTLSLIVAGSAATVSNKSNDNVLLQLSATKPDADSKGGEVLTPLPDIYATRLVSSGESTVWAKSLGATTSNISFQEG